MSPPVAAELERDGVVVIENILSGQELDAIEQKLARVEFSRAGTRNLLGESWCRNLGEAVRGRDPIRRVVPRGHRLVQCTLFEKAAERNWLVPLHQDLHLPVRERRDAPGLDGWSNKEGCWYVIPPREVLEGLVAVRLHADPCGADHGPLRVVPGSHREGRLGEDARLWWADRGAERVCVVERGGAVVMKPLVLHASSKARSPNRRRVLHFLFGPGSLPCGLETPVVL